MQSTSPSVYIVYDTLVASDRCGRAGSVIQNATISFQDREVSSYGLDGGETAVNFADLTNCTKNSSYATKDLFGQNFNPCFPSLQYEASVVTRLQPAWSTCVEVGGEVFDPPHALLSQVDPKGPTWSLTSTDAPLTSTAKATAGAIPPSIPSMTGPFSDPLKSTPDQATFTGIASPTKILTDPIGISKDPSAPSSIDLDPPSLGAMITGESTIQSKDMPSDPTSQCLRPSGIIVGGQSVDIFTTTGPGAAVIGSLTLSPEDPAITISGIPISVGSEGLIIGTSTAALFNSITDPVPPSIQLSVFGVIEQSVTILAQGTTAFEIGSATLDAQSPAITVSGTPISLGSDALIIGTSTILLPSDHPSYPYGRPFSKFTIGTLALTVNSAGITVENTEIVTEGGSAVTIDGNVVSLGYSDLVFGSRTETFAPLLIPTSATTTTTGGEGIGLGALILSGLGEVGGGGGGSLIASSTSATSVVGNTSMYVPFLGSVQGTISYNMSPWLFVLLGIGLHSFHFLIE